MNLFEVMSVQQSALHLGDKFRFGGKFVKFTENMPLPIPVKMRLTLWEDWGKQQQNLKSERLASPNLDRLRTILVSHPEKFISRALCLI